MDLFTSLYVELSIVLAIFNQSTSIGKLKPKATKLSKPEYAVIDSKNREAETRLLGLDGICIFCKLLHTIGTFFTVYYLNCATLLARQALLKMEFSIVQMIKQHVCTCKLPKICDQPRRHAVPGGMSDTVPSKYQLPLFTP